MANPEIHIRLEPYFTRNVPERTIDDVRVEADKVIFPAGAYMDSSRIHLENWQWDGLNFDNDFVAETATGASVDP